LCLATERSVQPAAAGRGPASRRCYPRRAGPIEMADQEPSRAAGLGRRRTNLTAETASRPGWSYLSTAARVAANLAYAAVISRRVLGLASGDVWRAHLPVAFASAGVALAIAAVRAATTAHALAMVALTLCIRLRPLPAIRRELRLRLDAAGLLGATVGIRWRLPTLVLGPEVPAADEDNP